MRPDPTRAALLTIDTQKDFTVPGAPAEISGTYEALPAMATAVRGFRGIGRPIVHVVRLYLPDGSNVDLSRRQAVEAGRCIVTPGFDGAELMDDLKPSPEVRLDADRLLAGELQEIGSSEWLLFKPRWGAFGTLLEAHLGALGVDTVVVCGCNFPNCPRTTVYEASERDFKTVLVSDATSGVYDRGLRELRGIGTVLLTGTECVRWLRESRVALF